MSFARFEIQGSSPPTTITHQQHTGSSRDIDPITNAVHGDIHSHVRIMLKLALLHVTISARCSIPAPREGCWINPTARLAKHSKTTGSSTRIHCYWLCSRPKEDEAEGNDNDSDDPRDLRDARAGAAGAVTAGVLKRIHLVFLSSVLVVSLKKREVE